VAGKKQAVSGDVMLFLGQIDSKLDGLAESFAEHVKNDRESFGKVFEKLEASAKITDVAAVEARVGILERLRWKLAGGAAALGLLGAKAWDLLP
jgi:hypothetical protein